MLSRTYGKAFDAVLPILQVPSPRVGVWRRWGLTKPQWRCPCKLEIDQVIIVGIKDHRSIKFNAQETKNHSIIFFNILFLWSLNKKYLTFFNSLSLLFMFLLFFWQDMTVLFILFCYNVFFPINLDSVRPKSALGNADNQVNFTLR